MTPGEVKTLAGLTIGAGMAVPLVLYLLYEMDSWLWRFDSYHKWMTGHGNRTTQDHSTLMSEDALAKTAVFMGFMNILIPIVVVCAYMEYNDMSLMTFLTGV